jgi:dTMP kinase
MLLLAVSAASALVGAVGSWHVSIGSHSIPVASSRVLLLLAGASGVAVGMTALRQMDDRPRPPAPPPQKSRYKDDHARVD